MIPWNRLPYEVQVSIVVESVNAPDNPSFGSTLLDILLLSRDVHDSLLGAPARGIKPHNDLFLHLFNTRFDDSAPRRRLISTQGILTPDHFAVAFKQRCTLLREVKNGRWFERINGGQVDRSIFERALWEVYLMLLEDDGQNMIQLERAGIEAWLREIILGFSANEIDDDGWPIESTVLRLAAASFAIVSDRASVFREGRDVNQQVIDALETFVLACHRYPHAHAPITRFYAEQIRRAPVFHPLSLPSISSMPVSEFDELVYFGHRLLLSPPPLLPSAIVIIANRQEKISSNYPQNLPVDRAAADAINFPGLTRADWIEVNHLRRLAIGVETPRVGGDNENLAGVENALKGSRRWDHVFYRMRAVAYALSHPSRSLSLTWFDAMYTPGMFTGFWLGRFFIPDVRLVRRMYTMHPAPLSAVRDASSDDELGVYINFFQANLREHITTDYPVGCGEEEDGNGVLNAYFPAGVDLSESRGMVETGAEVIVADPREPVEEWAMKRYQTWQAGMEWPRMSQPPALQVADVPVLLPEDVEMEFNQEGVGMDAPHMDVIITGETDYTHGKAFGNYTFYGRVRKFDGLMVLVRVPQNQDPNAGEGRWIFSGNMQLAGTVVGMWRATLHDVHSPGLQGPFVISRLGAGFNPPVGVEE